MSKMQRKMVCNDFQLKMYMFWVFRESTSSVQTNAVYGSFTSPIVALCNENFGECLNA